MYSLVLMMALGNGASTPAFEEGVREDPTPYASHSQELYRHRRRGGCNGCCGGGGCCGGWGGGCCGGGWGYGGCCGGGWGYGGCCGGGYGGYGWGGYGGYRRGYGRSTGYYSSFGYPGGGYYGEGYAPMPRESGGYYGESRYGGTREMERSGEQDRFGPGDNRGLGTPGPDRMAPATDRGTPPRGGRTTPGGTSGTEPPRNESRSAKPASIVVILPADARLMFDDRPTKAASAERHFVSPPIANGRDYRYTLKAELSRDGQTLTSMKDIIVRAGQETRVSLDFPTASVAQK